MYDQLKYRLPGEEVIQDQGAFQRLESLEDAYGFVLSDFLQQNVFSFHSGKSVSSSQQIKRKPIVFSKDSYLEQGNHFLNDLRKYNLGKAVYSRVKEVPASSEVKKNLFDALCKTYPTAFVYEVQSREFGHWIGATPERLIEGEKGNFQTVSLASTKRVEDNSPWGRKELEEQSLVSDFIKDQLNKLNIPFVVEERTELIAGPVKHLHTRFSAIVGDDASLLIKELHPTPAVSGLPREEAIELIKKIETHDRSLYTGFIGVLKEHVSVYVNLRCLQFIDEKAYLYLGGGYTKDSDVEKEWEETENKAKTLIRVMENL